MCDILNPALWNSVWSHFLEISILFSRVCGPMESMSSPCMVLRGLYYKSKLKASGINYNGSCFHHLKTLFAERNIVRQLFKTLVFLWLTRSVFLDVLSLFCFVQYLNRAVWLSILCHFLDMSILLSSFVVLWRPRFRRGSCQGGYIVPTSWEHPIWNIRTAASIIYKLCLWKATLSDNLIHVF